VSLTYRLTTHRLLRDHGFVRPAAGEVPLACVTAVRVERRGLQRWLGLGHIIVASQDNAAPLVLEAVYGPDRIADKIRRCAERARQRAKSCEAATQQFPGLLRAEHAERAE
jgi:hypothetical protein